MKRSISFAFLVAIFHYSCGNRRKRMQEIELNENKKIDISHYRDAIKCNLHSLLEYLLSLVFSSSYMALGLIECQKTIFVWVKVNAVYVYKLDKRMGTEITGIKHKMMKIVGHSIIFVYAEYASTYFIKATNSKGI